MVKQVLLWSLLLGTTNVFAVTAYVDRNPVALNESFQLVFEVAGNAEPDFTPLRTDFEILNQNQSSQISIINGQQTSKVSWTLNLMAKRAGNLIIPSIDFGQHGSSTPSTLTVQAAQAVAETDADVFLEVSAEPKNPYVQSQVLYTVRLFFAKNLNGASLTEPTLDNGELVVEKLGKDSQYQTQRNGRRFNVVERKYAVFPQQSGDFSIEPIIFTGKIIEGRSSRFGGFGFFGSPAKTRTQRLRSKAIAIRVKPIPETFTGKHWLPAQQLQLQENWSETPENFKAGEPITRTLTLLAAGLTGGQLPELGEFSQIPQGLKQYSDQPKLDTQTQLNTLISRREEKIAIIPSNEGEYNLPAIKIPWWNTKTEQMEFAQLPARTISVQPADNNAPVATPTPDEEVAQPAPTSSSIEQPANSFWMWLSIILAIAWLSTIIAWWWLKRRTRVVTTSSPKLGNEAAAIKKLKQACHSHQANATKEALLAWAKIHWQEEPPASLDKIGRLCGELLQTEIENLNHNLYSRLATEEWHGVALWKAFKEYIKQSHKLKEYKRIVDGLEPLYQV